MDSDVITGVASDWRPIDTAPKEVKCWHAVDLWMDVYACPSSFGMADSFRVTDCWRNAEGKWVHHFRGQETELEQRWITHWMPLPDPPKS